LSDGEFVMSAGAVQKYGVDTLEGMNAAGGGTNKPKMMGGTTYAAGGGPIGDKLQPSEIKAQQKEGARTPAAAEQAKRALEKPNFGPGATPTMSSQADMNKLADKITLEQRLKRIESQMQVQKALASGKGVNIRGASAGAQLGKGYGATYQGKKSIVIKGGAINFSTGIGDNEITLAGQRYFAMKRGNDVIYTPQDKRDIGGGGMFQPGGMFGGPRMSARGDYAAAKGKYYSSSDQKTYGSYNDAKAAKQSRMTSLASQQRLNKLSRKGGTGGSSGIRYDTEMDAYQKEIEKRGGLMGQFGRLGQRMFGGPEAQKKLDIQQKASDARVKQAGAESIGRYYSSSDGKYYANFAAADKARIARQRQVKPPVKPKPKPAYNPAGGGMGGRRGGGSSPGGSKPPSFSASSGGSSSKKQVLGIK
jgi:hypothetical protein